MGQIQIQKAPFLQNLTRGALGETFQYLDAKTSGFEKTGASFMHWSLGLEIEK